MKKILVGLLTASVLLAGCGSKGGNGSGVTTSCVKEEAEIKTIMKLTDKEGKINKLSAEMEIDSGKEITKEMQKTIEDGLKQEYSDYDGLDLGVSFRDTVMIMEMAFDLDKLDSLPNGLGGISSKSIKESNTEDIVKNLKSSGYSCSTK